MSAFIAPMVIFFAFSGSLQIFGLHEKHGSYTPNAVVEALGNVHKNQELQGGHSGPPHRGPSDSGHSDASPMDAHPEAPASLSKQLLKVFFFIEALALIGTTLLGVWIGVTHPTRARRFWILLGLGTLVPIVLLVV